ncbi:MAG: hypothetical protein KKC99_03975, partial [Proteobacteria bacterium]|nr:hypothetical protein [Pseudomonadota bacterium]
MVNRDKSIFFRRWLWTLLATLSLICPFRALAGSYVVSNTNDSGAGSFRQAILDLNAAADAANTITFNTSGTITLASLLDDVNEDVTFVGGSGVKVVLPSVGGGTNLSGLVMNGGGGTAFNGELPSFEVTGTADGILGVGGPIVEFNDDISGTISATAGTDEVYGIYGTLVRISDISGTVSAEAGRNDSIALVADAILDITGDVSGTLTATSGLDAAAVIGSPDVDIAGDISGVLTAHAGQDEAYGISADDFDLQGNLSGTISATADRDGAFGFYTTNTLYIRGTLSGTVSATAGGHTAIGLFNDTGVINGGAVNTALDISGNVSAEANGLAVGIAAWEAMNLNVTGSISGVDNSGGGAGYAVRSGRDDWVGGWAGDNNVDDVVQFGNGAFITGHVDLGGGTNALGMAGSGSMTGNLLNINTLDKADSGTWTINGRTAATNLSVAGGTLRMNNSDAGSPANTLGGTLTVNNGASMQLDVYQTAASSLDVTGAATVNGQVVFVPRALLASGTTFTAMTMASMAGTGQYTAPLFTVDTSSGNS